MTRAGESFLRQEEPKCDWFLESSKMQAGKRYICCLQIPWREVPGREKSYLSERAVLAQEQVPINLPGIHFSWKLEGPDCPRSAFLGLTSRRFYQDKNPNLFNAEVRQLFTDTIATPNSRDWAIWYRRSLSVLFSIIFMCLSHSTT